MRRKRGKGDGESGRKRSDGIRNKKKIEENEIFPKIKIQKKLRQFSCCCHCDVILGFNLTNYIQSIRI